MQKHKKKTECFLRVGHLVSKFDIPRKIVIFEMNIPTLVFSN